MASKNGKNGKVNRLEEAMATLLQNQALFVGEMAAINHRIDERFARMDERMARMEAILIQHSAILKAHTEIMQALPEAVRERMGFKPPA